MPPAPRSLSLSSLLATLTAVPAFLRRSRCLRPSRKDLHNSRTGTGGGCSGQGHRVGSMPRRGHAGSEASCRRRYFQRPRPPPAGSGAGSRIRSDRANPPSNGRSAEEPLAAMRMVPSASCASRQRCCCCSAKPVVSHSL